MKKYIFIVLMMLSSCSYKTRFTNLIRRHPDLLNVTDTIIVKDTFIIEKQTHDTIISKKFDTAFFYTVDSSARVRLINVHDSIKVNILLKGDTVFVTKKIAYKRALPIQEIKWYNNNWFYISIILMIIIFAFILFKLIK